MGEITQFQGGEKAPKNSVYIEVGETGTSVENPQIVKLHKGEKFPELTNQNRIWTYNRNQKDH